MKNIFLLLFYNFKTTYLLLPNKLKKNFKIVFFASILVIIVETLSFSIFIPLLDQIINSGNNKFFSFDKLFDTYQIDKKDMISIFLLLILIIFIFKTIILIIINKFKVKFNGSIEKYISNKLVENFLNQEFEDYKKYNNSKINKELLMDIGRYSAFISSSIDFLTEIFIVTMIVLLLMKVDLFSTLFIVLSLLIISSLYLVVTRKTFRVIGDNSQKSENKLIEKTNEISNLFKEIKIFNVEDKFYSRFSDALKSRVKHLVNYRVNTFLPRVLFELFAVSILVFLFFVLLKTKYVTGEIFLILGLLSIASFRIMPSIVKCLNSINVLNYCDASVKIINNKLVNLKNEFQKDKNSKILLDDIKLKEKIELVNINFKYQNSNKFLIKNLSFTINKGEFVGVIGPSGSGKSTLLDIIMQFQKEFEGEYLFDSLNVKKKKLFNNKSFLKNFGYVGQNTELMNDTIKNNIIFSSDDNKVDQKKLVEILRLTQLKSFIDQQSQGLEKVIFDNSLNISGGQKQRLGIARALYSNCSVLILDEITSSLDEKNQEKIISEIMQLKKEGKTIIQTTHNPNHLKYFDKVINLSNSNYNDNKK